MNISYYQKQSIEHILVFLKLDFESRIKTRDNFRKFDKSSNRQKKKIAERVSAVVES